MSVFMIRFSLFIQAEIIEQEMALLPKEVFTVYCTEGTEGELLEVTINRPQDPTILV